MKRLIVVAVILIVALVGVTSAALARAPHYATTLDATGTSAGPPSTRFIEFGQVHSTLRACRANRIVKVVAHYPDGSSKVLDTDRSSKNGAYAVVADFADSDKATIRAPRQRIGRPGHRRICDAGSVPAD